jgi:hypothetical protein
MATHAINWTLFHVCKTISAVCQANVTHPAYNSICNSEAKQKLVNYFMAQLHPDEIMKAEIEMLADDILVPACPSALESRVLRFAHESIGLMLGSLETSQALALKLASVS